MERWSVMIIEIMELLKWLHKKTKHSCKIMKKDIYNKNAREAHLMAEAYTNIYKEEFNPRRDAPEHSKGDPHPAQRAAESIIGAEVMFDGGMGRGVVDEVDVENGVAVVVDEDGGEHIVQLGDLDIVNPVEDNEEAQAYRDMSDRYKAEDSIEVGNVYKGESYHELVIGIKGDEVFTKKITLEDGNRYDKKQMLDEVKLAGKIEHDFLNEIM